MKILGFAGRRRAGKTLAARMVEDIGRKELGIHIKYLNFTSHVVRIYCENMGQELKAIYNGNGDIREEFLEEILLLSDRYKKVYGYNYFIDLLHGDNTFPGDNIVIDDVKTIEELRFILDNGGKVYKIEVDKPKRAARCPIIPGVDDHWTETELADLEGETFRHLGGGTIHNNKDPEDLRRELVRPVRSFFECQNTPNL